MGEKVKIVFLDRDGTLNVEVDYLKRSDLLELIPGADVALQDLKLAGFKVVVVSNQSGVGRGLVDPQEVFKANERLKNLVNVGFSVQVIDQVLVCMHHPDEGCSCRKPKTVLVDALREMWDFSGEDCWVVGDKFSDMLFGLNLRIPARQCVMVQTGYGNEEWKKVEEKWGQKELPTRSKDIVEAVEIILKGEKCVA